MPLWEVLLWLVAAFVAASSLVRLMAWYRDQLVERFRQEMRREVQRRRELEQQQQDESAEDPPATEQQAA